MKWFGESWGAPCCETSEHVATPIDAPCLRCEVPIADGDQGFVVAFHAAEGDGWASTRA